MSTIPMGLSMQDSFRRGSLPFKKRKLYYASPAGNASERMPISSSFLPFSGSDDEKIAALALVAAATAALPASGSFPGLFNSPLADEKASQLRMHLIRNESRGESFDLESSEQSDSQPFSPVGDPNNKFKGRQRIHHPPLTAPLPGGCHGRTSRNNSYCRRQPCFNGSKYCKLHYQQYIVAGIRAPADSTNSETSSIVVESGSGRTTPLVPTHQDKRYTGLEGEVRCLATTTRGRACAYVQVNDTRYCYLHSDYDTNPPPRRGGSNCSSLKAKAGASASESASGDEAMTRSDDPLESPSSQDVGNPLKRPSLPCSVLMKTPNKSPPSVTSEEESTVSLAWVTPQVTSSSQATTSAFRDETSPEESKEMSSEVPKKGGYPLLSSISSDQWFDKNVMISTGPLVNRTGRVVKWGNGWVSVRVTTGSGQEEDGLLHNRRSIELFLLPDGSGEEEGTSSEADVVQPMPEPTNPLRRCVTYETDAAAADLLDVASFDTREKSSLESSQATESTNESNSSGMEKSLDGKATEKSTDDEDGQNVSTSRNDENGFQNETKSKPEVMDAAQSPTGLVTSFQSGSPDLEGLPLVEMLAQEGSSKQQLDLLFGTAALERGRRTVHKPARYEDTAMLEKRK